MSPNNAADHVLDIWEIEAEFSPRLNDKSLARVRSCLIYTFVVLSVGLRPALIAGLLRGIATAEVFIRQLLAKVQLANGFSSAAEICKPHF
jgi:hypothetical protein